jgi:multidrug efflux pump subunit AcrA (membrane-fusion protein)
MFLIAVLCAVALAFAAHGARKAEPAVEPEILKVTAVRPVHAPAVRAITVPGDLVGRNEAALYSKVTGYLKRISVDKGDWVKKGQVLAEIEVPELEQKLKRARANRDVRHVTYERLNGVWSTDRRLVAREDVDVAQGELNQAQADVEELEALVGYTKIIAPFDGVVTARYVDPGALIEANGHASGSNGAGPQKSAAAPVVALADTDQLRVYVYVPEQEASVIRRGLPAGLTLREFPGREFRGTVARFSNALDLSTRTMLTEVDLENPDHELYPGMYADVTLELERHPDALELPATAVGGAGSDAFVFVVRNGTLAKISVGTGITSPGAVEITSGLRGDEVVVQNLSPGLQEGEKVQAIERMPQTALATP